MMRSNRRRSAYSGLSRDLGGRKTEWNRWIPRIKGEHILRTGILVALVAILTQLYPNRQGYEYSTLREGEIAQAEIIAPVAFSVLKTEDEYAREVDAALQEVLPVLVLNSALPTEEVDKTNALFEDIVNLSGSASPDSIKVQYLRQSHPQIGPISESTLRFLLTQASVKPERLEALKATTQELLSTIYMSGIVEDRAAILREGQQAIGLIRDGKEQRVPADEIRGIDELALTLQDDIEIRLPSSSTAEIKAVYELIVAYLTPNLTYDARETERRRTEATRSISKIKGTVLKGERIIDAHDRVTSEHIDKLGSLAAHIDQHRQEDPYIPILQTGARVILTGLMVAILFGFLKVFRGAIYSHTSNFVLFGIVILMPALVAHYAAALPSVTPYLVPVALSAMLVTVLFDAEIGLVVSLVCAGVCSSILGSLQHSLVFLITGIVGAYSVRTVLHRNDFYRSIIYLIVAYSLTIIATGGLLFDYVNIAEFFQKARWDLVFGVFTACACTVLTVGLLPIFESMFNVVTPITLLELSDLNRPLLRNLAIRAPGTYSHSIIMASLSEAAADAIGADRLLVRVGCYYHDIGKMIRPQYFIENQKGMNPHDELQPKMSALILISHVKEGIELAEEEGLPHAIVDLIPQHHGSSEIASFKHRALERGNKQAVRDEDFRYPGPRPQTKEAGIINLADAVESATRTLPNNSPDRIKGMVQTIVKGRFTSGELDECDLTLRDLNRIQGAFLPVLQATRHRRIPYPWQQEQQRGPREKRQEGKERT